MIRRRTLGVTGLQVSELGFGALEIGRDWAADVNPDARHLSADEAARVLNGVLDRGINFIDTAPAYWFSEEYIGRGLAHRRGEYVLATKVGEHCDRDGSFYDYSGKATAEFIDRSLLKLKTDVIDLIQIHSAPVDVIRKGEAWQALDEAQKAGKVRHIGMTGNVEQCLCAVETGGYETIQVPYNLLAPEAADRLFPLCLEKGIGVIIMRGLAGGKLTAKYRGLEDSALRETIGALEKRVASRYAGAADPLAVAAQRFVLAHPAVSTVIIGTRRLEAVDANLAALAEPLSPDEQNFFREVVSLE